jgi:hypothetical protein
MYLEVLKKGIGNVEGNNKNKVVNVEKTLS